ncbi:hypothetical protein D3C86_1664520 [compost metagenome]
MMDTNDIGFPVISRNITPPKTPNGMIDSTMMIPLNVLNWSSSTAMNRKVLNIMTERKLPPNASPSDSASPDNL